MLLSANHLKFYTVYCRAKRCMILYIMAFLPRIKPHSRANCQRLAVASSATLKHNAHTAIYTLINILRRYTAKLEYIDIGTLSVQVDKTRLYHTQILTKWHYM